MSKFVAQSLPVAKGVIQGGLFQFYGVLLDHGFYFNGSIGGRFANHLFAHPAFFRDKDDHITHDLCLAGQTISFFLLLEIEEFSFRRPHGGKIIPR